MFCFNFLSPTAHEPVEALVHLTFFQGSGLPNGQGGPAKR